MCWLRSRALAPRQSKRVETNSSVVVEANSPVEAKTIKWPILEPVESKYYLSVEAEYHSPVETKCPSNG